MSQNINQTINLNNIILPKKSFSMYFDQDFYRQLDQKNFYKKDKTKNTKDILQNELFIIKKTSKITKLTNKLKTFPSLLFDQILNLANFVRAVPPFKNVLEITSFLTKSRDF